MPNQGSELQDIINQLASLSHAFAVILAKSAPEATKAALARTIYAAQQTNGNDAILQEIFQKTFPDTDLPSIEETIEELNNLEIK